MKIVTPKDPEYAVIMCERFAYAVEDAILDTKVLAREMLRTFYSLPVDQMEEIAAS